MTTSNIRITDDILNEITGVYTCMLYFTDDIDKIQKEKFIKRHILSLNYEDINYIFNPNLGSKVSASPHAENKNLVKLQVKFIKVDINVQFVKSFEELEPPSYSSPPEPSYSYLSQPSYAYLPQRSSGLKPPPTPLSPKN